MLPLVDLRPFHQSIRDEVLSAMAAVYDSSELILGTRVADFERELAAYCRGGVGAVGVSSGTDALTASLMAAVEVRGEEASDLIVLTTPLTFVATASAVLRAGMRVQFVDVEEVSLGVCPDAVASHGGTIGALIAVHIYGKPCRIERLHSFCREAQVPLIEDAAQALGARVMGRAVGTFGNAGCFSFFPAKSLGALGDAGAVVAAGTEFLERLRSIRAHGATRKHHHVDIGGNFRLDALQAAVLSIKLRHLERRLTECRKRAAFYREALGDVAELRLPQEVAGEEQSYSVFTLRVLTERGRVQAALHDAGIASAVHYPTPLHLQPALSFLGYAWGDFPVAERLCSEVLSIPMYAELPEPAQLSVVNTIRQAFGYRPWS